jgi:hypothetical protein
LGAARFDRTDKERDVVRLFAEAVTGPRQRIERASREGIMGQGWVKRRASLRRAGCVLWVAAVASFSAVAAPSASLASTPHVPVLGSRAFIPRGGVGWGTYKPRQVFNGGDPSGDVSAIVWTDWGRNTAYGVGKGSVFKPGGGYYPALVREELRADRLGHCSAGGPAAYRQLEVRVPSRPGGPLGKWILWSNATTLCRSVG